jgi:hypothetical protein
MNSRSSGGGSTTLDAIVGVTPNGIVALCGSGISAIAPSFVPSWYRLNAATLDGIRNLAVTHVLSSSPSRAAVASLDPEDVPIATFSQVLSDAFAGRHWLTILTVLDGDTTNGVHQALASLIDQGRCHAIITTNFDTLLERACRETGLDVTVVLPGPPAAAAAGQSRPAIYKIHGSVQRPESMVDLLLDKRRGLGVETRNLLAASCRDQHLVVLGFSGEDFAMDADYLGLVAHNGTPARVTWVVRPGSAPTMGARAFLDALAARGVPVAIEQHKLQDLVGIASPDTAASADEAERRLASHVQDWLAGMLTYPPTAALVLAELLRLKGRTDEAAAVRAEIRLALPKFEQNALHLASAPAAWALLGKEEGTGEQALADLRRAELALDSLDQFVAAQETSFHGQALAEQQLLRAAIRQNAAIAWFHAGNVMVADRFLVDAERVLDGLPGLEAVRRIAGIRYRRALHALMRGELSRAMIALESSVEYAVRCGDIHPETASTLLLAMCLRASGEERLAAVLDRRATQLGVTTTHAQWRRQFEDLVRDGNSALASGMYGDLISAMTPDPLLDAVAAARTAGDPGQVANAMLAAVKRDIRQYGGERLGQLLFSLDLAGDRSATSLYQQTVRALCAGDLSGLPDRVRFLLKVTELGLDQTSSNAPITSDVVDELQTIGLPFDYQPCVFLPYGYEDGLRALALNAARAGNEAFRRRDYERAQGLYHLGYRGLWLSSAYELATTAALYRCDALRVLDRFPHAAACLALVYDFAARHMPFEYLIRHAEILAWYAQQANPATWPTKAVAVAELVTSIADHSPRHANQALLNGAINIWRLGQTELARQLLDRVEVSTLTQDEADVFTSVTSSMDNTAARSA